MSEHESTSRQHNDPNLTEADLARALATSLDRGRRLVRRRNQRRTALSGLAVVALLAGGFGVLKSISDDGSAVVVTLAGSPDGAAGDTVLAPTTSTTTSSSVPAPALLPEGWARSDVGGVLVITNPDSAPESTVDAGGGVALGGGGAQERGVELATSGVRLPDVLVLEFACVRGADDHIDELRVHREGDRVAVQATITGIGDGGCADGGATIEISVPEIGVTADSVVVSGLIDA